MWFRKKRKVEPKVPSKWDLSTKEALAKYGSYEALMIEMFKDGQIFGWDPVTQAIFGYLRSEYFKKNPQ